LSKAFSASIERIMSLPLFICSITFAYVEPSLHPWNDTDLVVVYDLFDVLDSVCQYFVENLASVFISDIGL
jgi:ABC-type uncharacterized transport system permease subunit